MRATLPWAENKRGCQKKPATQLDDSPCSPLEVDRATIDLRYRELSSQLGQTGGDFDRARFSTVGVIPELFAITRKRKLTSTVIPNARKLR